MERTPTVLYDTGSIPLPLRVLTLPFLVGALWLALLVVRDLLGVQPGSSLHYGVAPVLVLLVLLVLAWFLASLWFWRSWVYVDAATATLVIAHRGIGGPSRRTIALHIISGLQLDPGTVRGRTWWNASVVVDEGGPVWFTRLHGVADAARAELEPLAARLGCAISMG